MLLREFYLTVAASDEREKGVLQDLNPCEKCDSPMRPKNIQD